MVAADLYALAWQQAAGAPPSETREQRAQLQVYKKTLGSRRWRDEERQQAAQARLSKPPQQPERPAARPPRPVVEQRRRVQTSPRSTVRSSAGSDALQSATEGARSRTQAPPPVVKRKRPHRSAEPEPALLDAGQLLEVPTELRTLLEQIARDGATTTWTLIRKRLKGLPRLHTDDQCVVLWMVDDERRKDEPLLSALVTVGNRQVHPRYPAIVEQLGIRTGSIPSGQRTAWSYEVLKARQYWRHR
ncbi:hypothetical protein [Streptomyces sp. NRRL S-337]|uniref:hypothetical protein n=1 Tax=Streptomyces sp. NRRL S-337 TaxID=1463900 RepID=UPI00131C5844|nr:hypothetical protein [Streptomyces sp. NRRL S-337]